MMCLKHKNKNGPHSQCIVTKSDDHVLKLLCFAAVPDPPIEVELTGCDSRLAQIQWKLINENYSPVEEFIIEYNTSFDPDRWHVAKGQLPRDR